MGTGNGTTSTSINVGVVGLTKVCTTNIPFSLHARCIDSLALVMKLHCDCSLCNVWTKILVGINSAKMC